MVVNLRRLLFCIASFTASAALAEEGKKYQSLIDDLKRLEAELSPESKTIDQLHTEYEKAAGATSKNVAALALGAHYAKNMPKLALSYLEQAAAAKVSDAFVAEVSLHYAEAHYSLKEYDKAAKRALKALKKDLTNSLQHKLYGVAFRSMQKLNDPKAITQTFEKYEEAFRYAHRKEFIVDIVANAFAMQKMHKEEFQLRMDLATQYPLTKLARASFRRLNDLLCLQSNTKRPDFAVSKSFLRRFSRNAQFDVGGREWVLAQLDGWVLGKKDRQPRKLDDSEKAEWLFDLRYYKAAIEQVKPLYAEAKAADNEEDQSKWLLMRGRLHFRLNEPLNASRWFSLLLTELPKAKEAEDAREYLADSYKRMNMFDAAADTYGSIASRKRSRVMKFSQFWNTYRAKEFEAAAKLHEKKNYLRVWDWYYPESIIYWRAKTLEKVGKTAESREAYVDLLTRYGRSFYSQYLYQRQPALVNGLFQDSDITSRISKRKRRSKKRLASKGPIQWNLIEKMMALGLRDVALDHWRNSEPPKKDGEKGTLKYLTIANKLQEYKFSRKFRHSKLKPIKTAPKDFWGLRDHYKQFQEHWSLQMPEAYDSFVSAASDVSGIDRHYILSIMRAESHYNRSARSSVGARGLMQIMPYTGLKIARDLGITDFRVDDLDSPAVNIGFGAYYLAKLKNYVGWNPALIAASYNAGPHAVVRWLDFCKSCTLDEFIESIPYRETKTYTRKVLQFYSIYKQIYGDPKDIRLAKTLPERLSLTADIY